MIYNSITILIIYTCIFFSGAYANILRDPTQPPNTSLQQISGADLQIEAIFYSKNSKNSWVIIRGHKFKVGDKVMSATIIEIKPHEVKFKDDNGEFTITMSDLNFKSPTTKNNEKKKP